VLRQGGAELILHPGTMSVYDVNRPYSYEVGGEVLFVKLPRRPLLDRLGTQTPPCASAIEADSGLRQWVSGLVRQAATLEHLPGEHTADCVGDSVIAAVSSLLHATPGAPVAQAAMDAPLLARVCAYIESRIGEPELSPAAIAQAQCLSERSLHRLFAQIGTTPMRWVLQQRLRLSRRALEQDRQARVTDVAFAYGFNDLSHFSRAFKKAFSLSPGQLAAAARTDFPSH
jgi:AraC-like DNA-binding protein